MIKFLLGRIEGREIGISARMSQIKTTAKKSFLFFCSSLLIAMGILCPMAIDVYAEAVGPLPEGFNDIDLSDILITFPAGAGAGIKNQTVLSDLYNHYGASGWGVADMTPYFDIVVSATGESAGLSNSVLNEHLGDNDWFQQNGYDLKVNYNSFKDKLDTTESLTQYGANYIHQATLSPSTGNPWEWDWSSILEEYFKTGLIAFEHVFVPFDGLNAIAVTMDDVLENVYNFWTPYIESGNEIIGQINEQYLNQYGACISMNNTNTDYKWNNLYYDSSLVSILEEYDKNGHKQHYLYLVNKTNEAKAFITRMNPYQDYVNEGSFKKLSYSYDYFDFSGADFYVTEGNGISLKNQILNNEVVVPSKYSPDIINPDGNISIENYPDLSPSIEQGKAIRPIPQQAYQNWAQTNNLQDPAENGALMGALVTPYIENEPAPAPSPAPDDPWADPVPDTEPANRPVSPDQPDFPEEPELTDEEINESLLGATPDLTEIFPFCIPWDIARILKHFTATRKAPYIEWTFESDLFGFSYTFELDMAIFDDVAVILRLLELAGFIIGLAILTRYLIGAS